MDFVGGKTCKDEVLFLLHYIKFHTVNMTYQCDVDFYYLVR